MYLAAEAQRVFTLLTACSALEGVQVIWAYPYAKLPLRLKQPVLCVSPSGLKATLSELGGKTFAGEYSVDIDLFCPHRLGSPAAESILETAAAACSEGVSAVTFSALKNEESIDCFTAKCTLHCRTPMVFNEEAIWTPQQN